MKLIIMVELSGCEGNDNGRSLATVKVMIRGWTLVAVKVMIRGKA